MKRLHGGILCLLAWLVMVSSGGCFIRLTLSLLADLLFFPSLGIRISALGGVRISFGKPFL